MSNTFAGMTFTNIAQRGIALFSKRLLGLNIFTLDFSPEVVAQGTAVSTRIVPASAAPVSRASDTLAYNDATVLVGETTTAVTVTMNRNYVVGFTVTDQEAALIGSGVMSDTKDKIIEKKVNALADEMLTYVFGLITAASYTTAHTAVSAAAFNRQKVNAMRTTCAKANFPIPGTAMVLNPDMLQGLLDDAEIALRENSGLTAVVDGAGAIKRISGFDIYEAVTLPTNGEKLAGFTATSEGLAVAMRAIKAQTPAPGAMVNVVTDPVTGATLTAYMWYDAPYRRWVYNFETFYGAIKANSAALYRIVTP